jgi:hypothetical protein
MKKLLFMLLVSFSSFAQQETLSKWYITTSSAGEIPEKNIINFYVDNDVTSMALTDEYEIEQAYGPIKSFSSSEVGDKKIWNFIWKFTDGESYSVAKIRMTVSLETGTFVFTITDSITGDYIIYTGIKLDGEWN